MRGAKSYSLKVQINGPEGRVLNLTGRVAQTADKLIEAGELGITSFHHPGPRLSHYVLVLRKQGFTIETRGERHDGQFSGEHARYVLHTICKVLERGGSSVTPKPAFGGPLHQLGRGVA